MQLETELRDLQKRLDTLRQADIPDRRDEPIEANKRVRQGREQSPIRDQINKNVTETKKIARTSDPAQPTSPDIEKLRQKSRATTSRVTNTMTHLEAEIRQRQERDKLLQATSDRKLLPAVTALSRDFFELAQLERENREILDDLSDLYRTLTDDSPTDLLGDLDEAAEQVIVGDAGDIEFADSRKQQETEKKQNGGRGERENEVERVNGRH
jgi:hypothetical protein